MFDKMDDFISQGKGDEEYKQLFQDMYVGISVQSSNLAGHIFVSGCTFDLHSLWTTMHLRMHHATPSM